MTANLISLFEVNNPVACVFLLALGILLVVKGGDWFVEAASRIAEVSGIPTFIIGATIVSLATTLPEILVSGIAAAQGSTGMAIGNAVGSVNCNIALIMAISLLFLPSSFKRKDFGLKSAMLISAICLLWGFSATADKTLNWWEALIVLVVFVTFMVENVVSAKRHTSPAPSVKPVIGDAKNADFNAKNIQNYDGILGYLEQKRATKTITVKRTGVVIKKTDVAKYIFLFILGAACIVLGAQLMCDNGSSLASRLGVEDDLIGVTILAVGTSLPELVTTITAIVKKKADLSVGNVIGANVIDISLILPICAFISSAKFGAPLTIEAQAMVLDFPFCLSVVAFALIPAFIFGKFKRAQGALLLAGYITYITLLVLNTLGTISIF